MKFYKITLALFLNLFVSFAIASVSSDLGNFFNSMGFDQNITDPHAYQGQAAGYYTGGSIFLRNGVRNIQVMQIDVPSYRAGCGGIDLFFGGMSFIQSEQLIEFFKKTMQNAAGYAFNLALQTEVPELAHTLEVAQDWAQKMNSQNLSSCEMAEDLVGGILPQNAQAQRKICADIGSQNNIFADWTQARLECGKGNKFDEELNTAAKDPAYESQVTKDTNVVWNALIKNGFLKDDKELAEFFMSISGTIVFDDKAKLSVYYSLVSPELIKALMYGGEIPIYQCHDEKCLAVSHDINTPVNIDADKSLVNQITQILRSIQEKTLNDEVLSIKEQGFLQSTSLPVLKFITVNAEEGTGIDIASYAEVIAYDFLSHYLANILAVIKQSLTLTNYSPGIESTLTININQAQQYVQDMEAKAYKKVENTFLLIEQSRTIERQVAANVSSETKENINFGGQ